MKKNFAIASKVKAKIISCTSAKLSAPLLLDFYPEPFQRHQLPPALETYYQQHWQKMIVQGLFPVALGVLRVLTNVEQAGGISASAITRILDEDEYVVEEVLENWYEFLQQPTC